MYTAEENKIIATLKGHGIHVTKSRVMLFALFSKHKSALSINYINKHFTKAIDRVSVYRILKIFQQKGFLIKIPDTDTGVAYLFTNSTANEEHKNRVAYFICSSCKGMTMMSEHIFTSLQFPENTSVKKCHLIIEGMCSKYTH